MDTNTLHCEIEVRLSRAYEKAARDREFRRNELHMTLDKLILERASEGRNRLLFNCTPTKEDLELGLDPRELCRQYCEKHNFTLGAGTNQGLVIIFAPDP